MKFTNNLKGLSPIYDAYSKKHIYNLPNIGNKLEYSLCYKLNDEERRRIPNKTAGIYFLGLNFTTSNLEPFFSPAYVGSSVNIRDRLKDYINVSQGNSKVLNKSYELALKHIPQKYWTFVWAPCQDYQDVEKNLIKTLCTFDGVYLLNNKFTGSYSTGSISLQMWKRFFLDFEISLYNDIFRYPTKLKLVYFISLCNRLSSSRRTYHKKHKYGKTSNYRSSHMEID